MTTMRVCSLILEDNWPGTPNPNLTIPDGGWANTTDNFTTTSAAQSTPYPPGTKITAYSDNTHAKGYYTTQYLMYHDYSAQDINATDFSLSSAWCAHYDNSDAEKYTTDVSAVPYYVLSKCYTTVSSDITKGFPVALPCATIAGDGSAVQVTGYGDAWGWFWVGGVCPLDDVSHFRGSGDNTRGFDFTTDSLQRSGPVMGCVTLTTFHLMSCDFTNFADTTTPTDSGGVSRRIGWACVSSK